MVECVFEMISSIYQISLTPGEWILQIIQNFIKHLAYKLILEKLEWLLEPYN